MPSDYVAIKTFIKCDPLLVQLMYWACCYREKSVFEVMVVIVFLFFTAGENVTAAAVNESIIEVAWDQPAQLYIDLDNTNNSPALAGNM